MFRSAPFGSDSNRVRAVVLRSHGLVVCALLFAALAGAGCSKNKKSHRGAAVDASSDAVGAELNGTFAWEVKDLPVCTGPRLGLQVFVWRTQRTVTCDKTSGQWL